MGVPARAGIDMTSVNDDVRGVRRSGGPAHGPAKAGRYVRFAMTIGVLLLVFARSRLPRRTPSCS